jgi:hypothetical protein
LVSCNSLGRCSNYKDQNIGLADYNKIINPVLDNPNDLFLFMLTIKIFIEHGLKKHLQLAKNSWYF